MLFLLTLRSLSCIDIPFILTCSFIHQTPYPIQCCVVCHWQNIHSFHFPFRHLLVPLCSIHCLQLGLNSEYPSPVLANTRQLWPASPSFFSISVCWATMACFLLLSQLSPTHLLCLQLCRWTAMHSSKDNNLHMPLPIHSQVRFPSWSAAWVLLNLLSLNSHADHYMPMLSLDDVTVCSRQGKELVTMYRYQHMCGNR